MIHDIQIYLGDSPSMFQGLFLKTASKLVSNQGYKYLHFVKFRICLLTLATLCQDWEFSNRCNTMYIDSRIIKYFNDFDFHSWFRVEIFTNYFSIRYNGCFLAYLSKRHVYCCCDDKNDFNLDLQRYQRESRKVVVLIIWGGISSNGFLYCTKADCFA